MSEGVWALQLHGIHKRFDATVALDGVDLEVSRGALHVLLGENGAGKTTLMRVAFGMQRQDAGQVVVDSVPRGWRSSADAIAAGVGMVHQHFSLVPAMTVAENVALGVKGFAAPYDRHATGARVKEVAAAAGLPLDPDARAGDLPVSAQQRLEIVKALSRNARLLILDEPTAVLTPAEARELYAWLRRFTEAGSTAVLITHKVREALAVADEVTVLRAGRTVLAAAAAGLREEDVVAALIGPRATPVRHPGPADPASAPGPAIIRLDRASAVFAGDSRLLSEATLEIRRGEIVAVAGVEGSGHRTLLRLLAGRVAPIHGTVALPDRVGFVPEDRLRDALIPEHSLAENFALRGAGERRGRMPWEAIGESAAAAAATFDVRAPGMWVPARTLSGGNQQKFVLARELDGPPDALVVESPTRGLDVRATGEVLGQLREARARGVAVVVYSSDLDELIELGDRALVCFNGTVRETAVTAEAMGRAMLGAT